MTQSVLPLLVLCLTIAPLAAADPTEEAARETKQQLDKWVAYYQEVADGYDFRLKSNPEEPLKVSAEPIHVYTNPASGYDSHGAFFVWTRGGRAEAIGAIWSRLSSMGGTLRLVHHEFQSLSLEPFMAKGKDGLRWSPRGAGITLKEVEDAPAPAKSRELRLAQLRAIARRFTGFHVNPTEFQLRLLAQPLYRYEKTEDADESVDGAVFAFFMDWDPEILLVLETRPSDDGSRWHYAVGRFSNKPVRLEYEGSEVWEHASGGLGDPQGPFYAQLGVTQRPAVIGD